MPELYCNLPPTVRLTNVIALALSCVALTATAQNPNTNNVRLLSLRDAVNEALRNNLDVRIERYNNLIAGYNLAGAYGIYDPAFTFEASHRWDDVPSYFAPDKKNPDFPWKGNTDVLGPGITGKLPTGLTYDLSAKVAEVNHVLTDFADPFDPTLRNGIRGPTNWYYMTAGLNIRQPLLKNAWIDLDRQQLQISRKNRQISELVFRGTILRVVNSIELAYYELVYARENVKVQQTALVTAKQFLDETTKQVQAGVLTDLDQQAAQSRVETVQSDLLLAEQTFREQQNTLKRLLTDNYGVLREVEIVPTENLIALPEKPNRIQSLANALTKRPDILQMKLELERQNIVVKYTYNQLFPSLDFLGSIGVRSGTNDFDSGITDIRDINHPYYSIGVILSIPFSNRSAKNAHKASEAAREVAILKMQNLENIAQVAVDTSVTIVESSFKRVSSTRAAREFADAALIAEQKRLAAGGTTSFFVLERQNLATIARAAEIRALADYNKAQAQLSFEEGTTLEKNMIRIDSSK